jgi:hypothetical protein
LGPKEKGSSRWDTAEGVAPMHQATSRAVRPEVFKARLSSGLTGFTRAGVT